MNPRLPSCEDGTLTAELRARRGKAIFTEARVNLLLRLALFYLAFAFFFQWEIWRDPANRIESYKIGGDGRDSDAYFHIWNLWWVKTALRAGQNPLSWCDMVFAPVGGASLRFTSLSPIRTLLSAPFVALLGPVLVMNLWSILSFVLAGIGMALLVRRETASEEAGFLAGLAWAASAYHLYHFVRLDVQAVEFLPFLVFFLRRGNPTLAALAWLWGGLSAWYYVALGGVAVLIFGSRLGIRRFAILCAVFGLMAAPFILPVVFSTPPRAALATIPEASSNSLDLAALLLPSPSHSIFGPCVAPLFERMNGYEKPAWAIGATGLAGLAFLLLRRSMPGFRGRLLLLAGLGLAIAIGPHVRFVGPVLIGGEPIVWPPYLLVFPLPFFRGLRSVVRWALFVNLAAVVGFGALSARLTSARPRLRWALLALLVIDLARFPDVMALSPSSSAIERMIREDPRPISVLSIPPTETPTDVQMFQVRHEKPIVLGALTHVHEEKRDSLFDLVTDLPRFQTPKRLGEPDTGIGPRLYSHGIGWVVLHRGLIEEITGGRAAAAAKVRRFLVASLGPPTIEDRRIVAWRIGE